MPSTVVLEKKKQQVADLAERIKGSCAGVVVDYKGINVEMTPSSEKSFVKQALLTQ